MRNLPFRNIAEAKQNASALQKEFAFYSLLATSKEAKSPAPLSLQQMQEVIAKALGCNGWKDLLSVLSLGAEAVYFDIGGVPKMHHEQLVAKFAPYVQHQEKEYRIYRALKGTAFGCKGSTRNIAADRVYFREGDTYDQWSKIYLLQRGREYTMRYAHQRTPIENIMLEWAYSRNVALVLGKKPPRKPRRRKGDFLWDV